MLKVNPSQKKMKKKKLLHFFLETIMMGCPAKEKWRSFLKKVSSDTNVLERWGKNSDHYQLLAYLAKKYLCVPATLVPPKRVFSTASLKVNQQRCSLKPKNMDMLTFLNKICLEPR